MTDIKTKAEEVMDAFYSTFANKRVDFIIQDLNNNSIANVLREIVFQLQYYNPNEGEDMILDARDILDLCDELEKL